MIADIEAKIKRGKMRIALANGPDGVGNYFKSVFNFKFPPAH